MSSSQSNFASSALSGDDVLSALMAENDALGDFETAEAAAGLERWHFPRYPDADATDAEGNYLHPGDLYLSRAGLGPYDTDVETVVAWLEAPRNIVGGIFLASEPGTGKTALLEAAVTHAERGLVTHLCTPDDTRESLFFRFVGDGKGDVINPGAKKENRLRSPFTLGPIPRAAKDGHVLYLDEAMRLNEGVWPVIYSLMDGRHVLPGGNVDGSDITVHSDFRVVLSSNPIVRGAALPEPVASRCAGTTMHIETSAGLLTDLGIDEAIVAAWESLGTHKLWRPQIRELRVADYWLGVNVAQAISAFMPEHCPESQREAITNVLVGTLGAASNNGRLVVS